MRSLTVVGTLACGVFLVVSVAAFRKEKDTSGNDPKNGYGGFTFWAETSIPLSDPADYSGPDNLFDIASDEAIVAIRIGEGDDASCFNLNQTANPRLLGMSSDYFQERGSFTFHPFVKVWTPVRAGISLRRMWARRSFQHLSIALLCSGLLNVNWEIDLPTLIVWADLLKWNWSER